uniref:Gag_pre-integrs domain-containing protein n=1 Tax=Strongyloides venezuelensis TaxID=75913 RepID=A0A0K0G1C3_STRVS
MHSIYYAPSPSTASSQKILYSAYSSPTQPLLAIKYKQKKMNYQYTLAVSPYSHMDKGRRFSTFLIKLRNVFTIDGILDQDIMFTILRSRFADHTVEILLDISPNETFNQYVIRLSTIFDNNHLMADLETQYSFCKLNFVVKNLKISSKNSTAFMRRKLFDLFTSGKDLFMNALKSTAATNQTLLLKLLRFHSANQLLSRSNKFRDICSWCSIPGHKESKCRQKSNGFAKGNCQILKNNKKDSLSITTSLKKKMNNSKMKDDVIHPFIIKEVK